MGEGEAGGAAGRRSEEKEVEIGKLRGSEGRDGEEGKQEKEKEEAGREEGGLRAKGKMWSQAERKAVEGQLAATGFSSLPLPSLLQDQAPSEQS